MPKKPVTKVGDRYGSLVIIDNDAGRRGNKRMVACKCDCGNEVLTRYDNLTSGASRSCGCQRGALKSAHHRGRNPNHYPTGRQPRPGLELDLDRRLREIDRQAAAAFRLG